MSKKGVVSEEKMMVDQSSDDKQPNDSGEDEQHQEKMTKTKKRIVSIGVGCSGGSTEERNDVVATPVPMLRDLEREFNQGYPMYDPCPVWPDNIILKDGLTGDWGEEKTVCFVNPPYSSIKTWVAKVLEQCQRGRTIILLIPARPNSKYWDEILWPYATEIRFLSQKIRFQGFDKDFPIPLCLIVFEPPKGHVTGSPLPVIRHRYTTSNSDPSLENYVFYIV